MTSDNEDFWKFSFHELGIYDLPAFVDYILDRSSFSKMTIIAHSLANAATLVMTSTKPEYNDKINLFVGLAPYVFAVNFPPGPLAEPLLRSAVRYCNRVRKFEIFETRSINPLVRICDIIPLPCAFIYLLLLGITDIKYDLDLKRLEKSLVNLIGSYRINSYNHFDLVIAHDTKEMMYDHIVEIIGQNQEPPLVNGLSTKRTPRSPG
uniref:Lipase 1 n=1 Tax=Cacopsylla melanoneura TaxID=428564 RepID=A0A8D8SR95_9HEMI